jgi:hypothetical protein
VGFVVLLVACGFVLVPTVGLAGQSSGQGLQKLIALSGAGHKNSTAFHIKSTFVQIAYSYSHCPATGGNLFVSLVRRGMSREYVHVQGPATKSGRVRAYPRPGTYHLSISSVCRWYVAVYGH